MKEYDPSHQCAKVFPLFFFLPPVTAASCRLGRSLLSEREGGCCSFIFERVNTYHTYVGRRCCVCVRMYVCTFGVFHRALLFFSCVPRPRNQSDSLILKTETERKKRKEEERRRQRARSTQGIEELRHENRVFVVSRRCVWIQGAEESGIFGCCVATYFENIDWRRFWCVRFLSLVSRNFQNGGGGGGVENDWES